MYDDNRVRTISCYIFDKLITELIRQGSPVKTFRSIGVNEDDACISVGIDCRIDSEEIPTQCSTIGNDAVLQGFEWTDDIWRCARSRSTCGK